MTISSDTNKIAYPGDNATEQFMYDFLVPLVADMTVVLDDVIQSTGYTVNGAGNDAGGDVTFDVAPGAGVKITLIRELDITQEMDLRPYDAFPADTVEDAFDKLTMISQDIQEQVDRSVTAPVSDDGSTDYTMPSYQAGAAITWDATEQILVNSGFPLQQYVDDSAANASAASSSASNSSTSATQAQLEKWEAEAEAMTADSYATQTEDVFVNIYSSSGNGGFTSTPTTDYSALHWAAKAFDNSAAGEANTTSNLGVGVGLATTKSGVNLPFRSLAEGDGITLSAGTDTVTITAEATSLPTITKGDLVVRDATTDVRLPVGTDGQILVAASGDVNGVDWVDNSLDLSTPTITKGDTIVDDGANVQRLPVGVDGQAMLALDSDAYGLAYGNVVQSDIAVAGLVQVINCVSCTQTVYNGLSPDAKTLYVIVGA